MKDINVLEAEKEAIRFLEKVKVYKESDIFEKDRYCWPSQERAAMKRSSMDLTKALSKMRNDN